MSAKSDELDEIGNVLLRFFETPRIRQSLDAIHRVGVTGWEKWWQTELALYLATSDDVAEWDMEHPFDTDQRTRLGQSRMALDIGFRMENQPENEWHFVELKQDNDYINCIGKMCVDADKVFSARKRSFEGIKVKYIACAGVFLTVKNEEEVLDCAEGALEVFEMDSSGLFLEKVGKHHSILIF